MNHLEQWFRRKSSRAVRPFEGWITVGHEIKRVVGPRSRYARVVLSATPAEEFTFTSKATWPASANCDGAVLRAILDVLMGQPAPAFGVNFVLKEVGWDDINSDEETFYAAARAAVGDILRQTGNWAD